MSHALGAKCLCCGAVIQSYVCPEGCPGGHGYAYTVCSACETAPEEPGRCKAHRDGECHWTGCPQVRDGEPRATGRHCPLDNRTAPEEES